MMLAHLISRRLRDVPLEQAKELVRAGAVYNGHLRIRVPSARVVQGERITVYPEAAADEPLPPTVVSFIHRDPDFVVLDKPVGVPVAATKQSARGTLSEALRRALEAEGVLRPYVGIVHRLDRGASGLVLFTTRSVANPSVHRQFTEHEIDRRYRVLVHGEVTEPVECDAPLLELHSGTSKVAPGNPHARAAMTRFVPLVAASPVEGTTLLEATLSTGRHHQIRVHAAHLGHPVVGDRRYGQNDDDQRSPLPDQRLHLHAWFLRLAHPTDARRVEIVAPCEPWAQLADPEPEKPR